MLNRTNRTLSAHTHRLNLGTRSLVLAAGVNNGTTLRFRPAHASHPGASVRVEAMRFEPTITGLSYRSDMPDDKRKRRDLDGSGSRPASTPSSSAWSRPSWLWACAGGNQGRVAAEAPPVLRPVVVVDVPSGRPAPQHPGQPTPQAPSRPAASTRASRAACPAGRSARSTPLASAAAS